MSSVLLCLRLHGDMTAATQLTAPADASAQWVSPAFLAGGELRASIKVPGLDWWRTEFTLYKGDLYWRDCDIPDNWLRTWAATILLPARRVRNSM